MGEGLDLRTLTRVRGNALHVPQETTMVYESMKSCLAALVQERLAPVAVRESRVGQDPSFPHALLAEL